ncbi:MAG: response regulator [Bryobacteraceae bacterium]|nr:response regulator [Bryobacteraceae bacterium]
MSHFSSRVPRILVVEDNAADAHLLRMGFAASGAAVEVRIVGDGGEAIRVLDAFRESGAACDLLLLDLNAPVMSGYEVLQHVRSDPRLKCIPVVVLSGSTNPDDIERCYSCGANSYVGKPESIDEVFALTRQLVSYWFECVRLPGAGARAAACR